MKRKDFLRNAILGLCFYIAPKSLLPTVPEPVPEEMVDVEVHFVMKHITFGFDRKSSAQGIGEYDLSIETPETVHVMKIQVPKSREGEVNEYIQELYIGKKFMTIEKLKEITGDS